MCIEALQKGKQRETGIEDCSDEVWMSQSWDSRGKKDSFDPSVPSPRKRFLVKKKMHEIAC